MFFASSEGLSFTDVAESAWYYNDVKNAVAMGLINGKSETEFKPDDFLTYAEAFKLAACMHQVATCGEITLKNGDPWYAEYIEYCLVNGIFGSRLDFDSDSSMNEKITRAGYMGIFANALPDEMLSVINYVPDGTIPDVPATNPDAPGVYKLYRAERLHHSPRKHNVHEA